MRTVSRVVLLTLLIASGYAMTSTSAYADAIPPQVNIVVDALSWFLPSDNLGNPATTVTMSGTLGWDNIAHRPFFQTSPWFTIEASQPRPNAIGWLPCCTVAYGFGFGDFTRDFFVAVEGDWFIPPALRDSTGVIGGANMIFIVIPGTSEGVLLPGEYSIAANFLAFDKGTGQVRDFYSTGGSQRVVDVPAPSSLVLFGSSLVLLAFIRWYLIHLVSPRR